MLKVYHISWWKINTESCIIFNMNENVSLSAMILKSTGIFNDDRLERIITNRAANPAMGLTEAAVKFGGYREIEVLEAVGRALGLDVVDLERQQPNAEALTKLPASAVYQYNVLPFKYDGTALTIVTSDPFDTAAVDGLRLVAGCVILAFGMTIVIRSDAGTGPNDLVALVLSEKTGWKFSLTRIGADAFFALTGWALGGVLGLGTLICMFLVGPVAGFFLPVNGRWIEKLVRRFC